MKGNASWKRVTTRKISPGKLENNTKILSEKNQKGSLGNVIWLREYMLRGKKGRKRIVERNSGRETGVEKVQGKEKENKYIHEKNQVEGTGR